MYECRIERDSINLYGERLVTVVIELPRIILAELNTHRLFSRSSASSRAIPVQKQIQKLKEDPFVPFYWGKNQKGMQATEELTPELQEQARALWLESSEGQIAYAEKMMALGVHKQLTNRLLECFMWHQVIITATEWDNWDHLRRDKDAAPEIQRAAELIHSAMDQSRPTLLRDGEWHLPFVDDEDRASGAYNDNDLVKISVGRSARVSYNNHDGERNVEDDMRLADRCRKGHMAPWEHAARPMTYDERDPFEQVKFSPSPTDPAEEFTSDSSWHRIGHTHFLGNFNGWVQARKLIHGEWDILGQKQKP